MTVTRKRWIIVGIIAACIAIGLIIWAAINQKSVIKTAVTPQPSPSSSPSPTASASPQPTSVTPPTPTASPIAICKASILQVGLKPDNAGAGHFYYDLSFTNTGSSACSLFGQPTVTLADAAGNQLGTPAEKTASEGAVTVVLAPNDIAHSEIDYPNPAYFQAGACTVPATSLHTIPPGNNAILTVKSNQQACPGWSVEPVKAGASE
ncbi:DUF4232 domain-containing protein [Candidatus Saccharibacteria bacterium]|nr:DUF4232 domain-containing protein [Candidatus Saccharibacteria bacterium]